MELRVLNKLYQPVSIVEDYESLIWTERFCDVGDFELHISSYPSVREDYAHGTLLGIDISDRIMMVNSFEEKTEDSGKRVSIIKGNSLESIFKDRIIAPNLLGLKPNETADYSKMSMTAPPGQIMRNVVTLACFVGTLSANDKFITIKYNLPIDPLDIPEPADKITAEIPIGTVFDAIKQIGENWDLGFSIAKERTSQNLAFRVYSGRDRTTSQTKNAPVVFSPELDNLTDVTEISTTIDSKNVAYVFGADKALAVYPEGMDPSVAGFERRVMHVLAEDISSENTTNVVEALTAIGRAELAKHRTVRAFDGEIRQDSQYLYSRDYNLGDIVEMRIADGTSNRMRVTEQIFVSDANGVKSYPTLMLHEYVNRGSWLSWESNKQWVDFEGDNTAWADLP